MSGFDTPPPPHPQGVRGILRLDFVGASHAHLVSWLETVPPDRFHCALIDTIRAHGATHNQRKLITAAIGSIPMETAPESPTDPPNGELLPCPSTVPASTST